MKDWFLFKVGCALLILVGISMWSTFLAILGFVGVFCTEFWYNLIFKGK